MFGSGENTTISIFFFFLSKPIYGSLVKAEKLVFQCSRKSKCCLSLVRVFEFFFHLWLATDKKIGLVIKPALAAKIGSKLLPGW